MQACNNSRPSAGAKLIATRSSRNVVAPCQPRTETPTAPPAKQLDPALLARLEKAKQYKANVKKSPSQQPTSTAPTSPAARQNNQVGAPPSESAPTQSAAASNQAVYDVTNAVPNPPQESSVDGTQFANVQTGTPGMFEPRSTTRGSSSEAAYWLKSVLREKAAELNVGLDAANMRPEEYTRMKEARSRTQQVEIISVDKSYKPSVSTWGVFPRPDNISQAFGGGRNIEPGQELESEEEAKARRARTDALLDEYKRQAGTLIDKEVELECDRLYQEAEELFRAGCLQAAYDRFDAVTQRVVVKTRIGGLATLQKALCLDSMGLNKQAQPLYRSLALHPNPIVSKRAKQMLFGFQAASFLKADTIDYSGKKKAWAKYFTRNSAFVYVQSDEEREKDEAAMRAASAVALVVMVSPVAAFALAALNR